MKKKIYDISINLSKNTIFYPGDLPFNKKSILSLKKKDICSQSNISMSSHSGTHIDFPEHFILNSKNSNYYSIENFIFKTKVVEIINNSKITYEEIKNLNLKNVSAVLFKTKNSLLYKKKKFSENYIYLTLKATEFLVKKNVKLVGIDYLSIEKYGVKDFIIHKELLGNNILILEGINLKDVPQGNYDLYCFPLKIYAVEAAPARAVLFT